ncbi:hypothetical protein ACWGIU_35840 [Streptomyces sp. NPDC054840]
MPPDERLRCLRAALAHTTDLGTGRSERDECGQDHFVAVEPGWLLAYDACHPHRTRVAFPPEGAEHTRRRLFAAAEVGECRVLEVMPAAGTPPEAWDAVTDEGDQLGARGGLSGGGADRARRWRRR